MGLSKVKLWIARQQAYLLLIFGGDCCNQGRVHWLRNRVCIYYLFYYFFGLFDDNFV